MEPIVRQLCAAALACSGAYGAGTNYEQFSKFPLTPTPIRMEQAGQTLGEWVVVSDATYHCNQSFVLEWSNPFATEKTNIYYVLISDPKQEHSALLESGSQIPCPPPTGHDTRGVFLHFGGTIAYEKLLAKGLRMPSASVRSSVLQLCSACGPGNSLLGLGLFSMAGTIGVLWSLREIRTVLVDRRRPTRS